MIPDLRIVSQKIIETGAEVLIADPELKSLALNIRDNSQFVNTGRVDFRDVSGVRPEIG
jgi:hypothetical protein